MNIKNSKITYLSLLLASTLFIGCGGDSSSGPSKNSGTGSIDLADYFANQNITKTYYTSEGNETKSTPDINTENIEVTTDKDIITIINTDKYGNVEKTLISDKNITRIGEDFNFSSYRHVNIGDTFFKQQEKENYEIPNYAKVSHIVDLECTIAEQLKTFSKGEHQYDGDILKIECIDNGKITVDINQALIEHIPTDVFKDINGTHDNYDTSFYYFEKGIGEIVGIDDDCILVSKEPRWQDDRKKECIEKYHSYEYYIEPTK